VHADPGGFGYYPLIDRKNGYYMQIVAYENFLYYPRSGIPEYLGAMIKPLIDAIMTDVDITVTAAHHSPEFNSMSLTDVNYIAGCFNHPTTCL
jgi:hypothetical protein